VNETLWRARLDSDFNSRYWGAQSEKYARWDFWLKLFLAVAASGTVGAWGLWSEQPALWKALSAAAAIASVASPLLGWGKKAEGAAFHAGAWAELRVRYADLWDNFQEGAAAGAIAKEHDKLRNAFTKLERDEAKLGIAKDGALAERCQQEVLRANGVQSAPATGGPQPSRGQQN